MHLTASYTSGCLGSPVDVLEGTDALDRIFHWASRNDSRIVCACDAHSIAHALRNPGHAETIAFADMVDPTGLRCKGHRDQGRISGPDLMWERARRASQDATPLLLYGSTSMLRGREQRLRAAFPAINVVEFISPPFSELSAEEDGDG